MQPIVQEGDPVLRRKAKPVPKKDISSPALLRLLARMSKALAATEHGVALAAPQIGQPLRIFIVSKKVLEREYEAQGEGIPETLSDLVFINPDIVRLSRKKAPMDEGCLSVKGLYGVVERHEKATVRALDRHGKPFTYHGSGLMAQIFQHETDHLDGILFIDKARSFHKPEEAPEKV